MNKDERSWSNMCFNPRRCDGEYYEALAGRCRKVVCGDEHCQSAASQQCWDCSAAYPTIEEAMRFTAAERAWTLVPWAMWAKIPVGDASVRSPTPSEIVYIDAPTHNPAQQ